MSEHEHDLLIEFEKALRIGAFHEPDGLEKHLKLRFKDSFSNQPESEQVAFRHGNNSETYSAIDLNDDKYIILRMINC